MRVLRRLSIVVGVLAGVWWVAARWWQSTQRMPAEPATPWPPVPVPPTPAGTAADGPDGAVAPVGATGDAASTSAEAPADAADAGDPASADALPPEPATPSASSWLLPAGDGSCPPGHPVKAKDKSRLYHLPGMFAYGRCVPDRCYATAAAAEADGYQRAKR
ncbi:MAG TPA: hypothetical protein VFP61_15675 [Acidimicrobiales bacterium]|nr:hypothetical protein [Acidimicrobiales bacterium]